MGTFMLLDLRYGFCFEGGGEVVVEEQTRERWPKCEWEMTSREVGLAIGLLRLFPLAAV
jgi:hypothetical protein